MPLRRCTNCKQDVFSHTPDDECLFNAGTHWDPPPPCPECDGSGLAPADDRGWAVACERCEGLGFLP